MMSTTQIITANALVRGGVVFLTSDGDWSGDIQRAAIAEGEPQSARLLEVAAAAGNRTRVVEPYAIDVRLQDGAPTPVRLRERIRASGPTVRDDLVKLDIQVGAAAARGE